MLFGCGMAVSAMFEFTGGTPVPHGTKPFGRRDAYTTRDLHLHFAIGAIASILPAFGSQEDAHAEYFIEQFA
jgi:hypothetical protein